MATLRSKAASDGQVTSAGAVNSTAATASVGDNKANQQAEAILTFNTGSLPDYAIITGAQLMIKRQSQAGLPFSKLGSLAVDIKQPYFGSKLALEGTDFADLADHDQIGTISVPLNPVNGAWYSATLDPTLFNPLSAKMNTQLRLRFTGTAADGIADYLKFYTGNSLTTSYRPKLIVTFMIP